MRNSLMMACASALVLGACEENKEPKSEEPQNEEVQPRFEAGAETPGVSILPTFDHCGVSIIFTDFTVQTVDPRRLAHAMQAPVKLTGDADVVIQSNGAFDSVGMARVELGFGEKSVTVYDGGPPPNPDFWDDVQTVAFDAFDGVSVSLALTPDAADSEETIFLFDSLDMTIEGCTE